MSSESEPGEFHQEETFREFEHALQSLAPKPVSLDLSLIDQCVTAPGDVVARAAAPQWRLASASWVVGLATGLLVAILGGGAFRPEDAQSEVRATNSPAKEPVELPATAPNSNGPLTATIPASAGWSNQTDYVAAFSPANIDSAHRVDIASRGLLVSFRIDDAEPISDRGAGHTGASSEVQPPASLGELRKQLQLAL